MKVNLTADSTDFMLARTANVESLGLQLQEYHHQRTGAVHFHLQADDPNNAFTVAFRTVPTDSTGVAHILEAYDVVWQSAISRPRSIFHDDATLPEHVHECVHQRRYHCISVCNS